MKSKLNRIASWQVEGRGFSGSEFSVSRKQNSKGAKGPPTNMCFVNAERLFNNRPRMLPLVHLAPAADAAASSLLSSEDIVG